MSNIEGNESEKRTGPSTYVGLAEAPSWIWRTFPPMIMSVIPDAVKFMPAASTLNNCACTETCILKMM